ncbi:MAG: patatin-like phospholipase family protein [Chloroflexi bacterium]|nr:patatin-like phospholipase family protein [Chloroflexota bacterium]
MEWTHRPVVGLTLSGGGARGLAHISVLKVIERRGIRIDCMTGVSMGGIFPAGYAAGMTADELEAVAPHMASLRRLIGLLDVRPPNRGSLAGHKVRAFFARYLPPDLTFADLRIPLALEAVDLDTGEEIALREGSVLQGGVGRQRLPGRAASGEMERETPGGRGAARQHARRPGAGDGCGLCDGGQCDPSTR